MDVSTWFPEGRNSVFSEPQPKIKNAHSDWLVLGAVFVVRGVGGWRMGLVFGGSGCWVG